MYTVVNKFHVLYFLGIKPFDCSQETAERCVVRLPGRTDGDSEEDLDEEGSVGSEIHLRRQVSFRQFG